MNQKPPSGARSPSSSSEITAKKAAERPIIAAVYENPVEKSKYTVDASVKQRLLARDVNGSVSIRVIELSQEMVRKMRQKQLKIDKHLAILLDMSDDKKKKIHQLFDFEPCSLTSNYSVLIFEKVDISLADKIKQEIENAKKKKKENDGNGHFTGFEFSKFCMWLRQMLEALKYLKTKTIVHQDIRPKNFVFLASDQENVKLTGFEYARYDRQKKRLMGNRDLNCLAPEVLQNKSEDHKSDVFSVGIIAIQMFVGQDIFSCGDDTRIRLYLYNRLFDEFPEKLSDDEIAKVYKMDKDLRPTNTPKKLCDIPSWDAIYSRDGCLPADKGVLVEMFKEMLKLDKYERKDAKGVLLAFFRRGNKKTFYRKKQPSTDDESSQGETGIRVRIGSEGSRVNFRNVTSPAVMVRRNASTSNLSNRYSQTVYQSTQNDPWPALTPLDGEGSSSTHSPQNQQLGAREAQYAYNDSLSTSGAPTGQNIQSPNKPQQPGPSGENLTNEELFKKDMTALERYKERSTHYHEQGRSEASNSVTEEDVKEAIKKYKSETDSLVGNIIRAFSRSPSRSRDPSPTSRT